MFRASLCPSSGEQDVLLHVVCCAVTSGESQILADISCNVFFVWYCVVNLDEISCVYEDVVCKSVCRGVGLVYVSCAIQVWRIGAGALMHELCLLLGGLCGAGFLYHFTIHLGLNIKNKMRSVCVV